MSWTVSVTVPVLLLTEDTVANSCIRAVSPLISLVPCVCTSGAAVMSATVSDTVPV